MTCAAARPAARALLALLALLAPLDGVGSVSLAAVSRRQFGNPGDSSRNTVLQAIGSEPAQKGQRGGQIPLMKGRLGGKAGGDPIAPAVPLEPEVAEALGALAKMTRNTPVHVRLGTTWTPGADGVAQPGIWVAGELDAAMAISDARWEDGATVSVQVMGPDGFTGDGGTKSLDRDGRCFRITLPPVGYLKPGDYSVTVAATPAGATVGHTQGFAVRVPAREAAGAFRLGDPTLSRRGPFSNSPWVPAADLRYRRQETIRVEVAVAGPITDCSIHLLDRFGRQLALPVAVTSHDDSGVTIVTGELTLAPLASGDFLLDTHAGRGPSRDRRLAAFRIVP